MKFSDYESGGEQLYEELAQLVKSVIEKAASKQEGIPRIQAFQARAKAAKSLKRKLQKRGILDADDIEQSIKDLAGARVVLYSNIDVDRFLQHRLIPECLVVHWEETKAHYPNAENDGVKYEGFHYVVSLPDGMIAEPGYEKFKSLRCEIQIQTLLAHAFAESSHDIIYKGDETPGFGAKSMEAMRTRLNKTVDEYLRPAGFELDKVQADYERLRQGTDLFERGALESLALSADNNERYDRLKGIAEHLIPHYDDLGNVFREIQRSLMQAISAARATPYNDIDIEGHKYTGHGANDVARLVVQIFADLRYIDIEGTAQSLFDIYIGETDRDVRKQVLDTAKKLASYNIQVWKQAGPYVQVTLADMLSRLSDGEIEAIRPLATTIWRELLSSEMDDSSWAGDTLTISRGAVPASDDIKSVRSRAIDGLLGLLDRSQTDDQRLPVLSAFWEATRLPTGGGYPNELMVAVLRDMKVVADQLLPRLPSMQFDLWEHIESHLFRQYRRFKSLANADDDKMGCKAVAAELVTAILSIRNRMNRNRSYVRYKTLVGFEGVFSQQWDNEGFGYAEVEALRKARAARFVDEINDGNTHRWLSVIKKCAATKSNDWATFPIFNEFLILLGEKKPQVALQALADGDENILNFLPAILAGLAKSDAKEDYERIIGECVASGRHLAEVARQYRVSTAVTSANVAAVLKSAVAHGDRIAAIECLVFAIAKWHELGDTVITELFMPALEYLSLEKDCRWVRGAWFLREASGFFARLTEGQSKAVLDNLLLAPEVDHELERILVCIGNGYPGLVWRYFGDRLLRDEDAEGERFDAIPFQLYELNKILGADPSAAINELRSWFKTGDNMFQFTGGKLLHSVFPTCTEELAAAAIQVAAIGGADDINFVLNAFRNYRGEPTLHPLAKMLVKVMAEDDTRLSSVEILLENTGVVSGEFGMVEAMRERKALMGEWLKDDDDRIQAFAKRCIHHLNNRIATEQRDAEMRKEHRKRDYE